MITKARIHHQSVRWARVLQLFSLHCNCQALNIKPFFWKNHYVAPVAIQHKNSKQSKTWQLALPFSCTTSCWNCTTIRHCHGPAWNVPPSKPSVLSVQDRWRNTGNLDLRPLFFWLWKQGAPLPFSPFKAAIAIEPHITIFCVTVPKFWEVKVHHVALPSVTCKA